MRWMTFVLLLIVNGALWSQVQKIWVGDTSKVSVNIFEGDTTYRMKWKYRTGEWEIYYDNDYHRKATWVKFRSEFSFEDSCWSPNGKLISYWKDKDEIAFGCYESKSWYPNGHLHFENYCANDTALHHEYYRNGQLKLVIKSHKDSASRWMFEHYVAYYYENGQPKCDPQTTSGPWYVGRYYYESGKLMRDVDWAPGKTSVHHCEWYENGNYRVKGQYNVPVNYRIFDPRNIRAGTWFYYSESGKLIKEEFYEEGKLVRTVEH